MPENNIKYHHIDNVPGDYFECSKMRATLSTNACAANWREAMAKPDTVRLHHCKGCPIGALHAGETDTSVSTMFGSSICSRCHEGGRRLLQGRLCICCYNRQLEALKGKNSKGATPKKLSASQLSRRVAKYCQGGKVRERSLDLTTDTLEVMVSILRGARGNVQFGFIGHARLIQGRLF